MVYHIYILTCHQCFNIYLLIEFKLKIYVLNIKTLVWWFFFLLNLMPIKPFWSFGQCKPRQMYVKEVFQKA